MSGKHTEEDDPMGDHNLTTKTDGSKVAYRTGSSETTALLNGQRVSRSSPPLDTCYSTYLILCIHGIGHLLPWNFFITAKSYFEDKFRCHHSSLSNHSTSCSNFIEQDFENFFSVAAMLPIATMGLFNIWLQSRVHYKYRLICSLVVMLAVFILTCGFVYVDTSSWTNGFFALTLVMIVVINIFSAIFQSSTFGFAGVLPPKYIASVMSGQACAGIFAAVALIITIASTSNDSNRSALGYFAVAAVVVVVCLLTFFILLRLKFVRYYLERTTVGAQATQQRTNERTAKQHSTNTAVQERPPFHLVLSRVLKKIIVYAISVFLVFSVTLSLFPAVLSQIESSLPNQHTWLENYFSPIVCFLMFNSSDFAGRFMTQWVKVGSNRYALLLCALLRVIFIPLFLFCNYGKGALPVLFAADAYPVVFVTLFGLSNGYLGSMLMISAPMSVAPEERETASTIMAFFLAMGLFAGSWVSFLWTKVVLKF